MTHPALIGPISGDSLPETWSNLYLPEGVKTRLRNHALLAARLRADRVDPSRVPIHGLAILQGPPGTGKTTLGRGLAAELRRVLRRDDTQLVVLDPHQLTSAMFGRTQKTVVEVLNEAVPGVVANRLTVLLVDEVEALATARSLASLETNPADIHRATDAVLSALDRLAEEEPSLIVVATTNFVSTVDDALLSRADLVLEVPLPTVDAIASMLVDTLTALGEKHVKLLDLARSPRMPQVAERLLGRDGRTVRKFVLEVLASEIEITLDPNKLTIEALVALADSSRHTGDVLELPQRLGGERAS